MAHATDSTCIGCTAKNNAVKRFKLTKKRVLGLVNVANEEEVLRYAKDKKLSFRKEEDLNKILEYSGSL